MLWFVGLGVSGFDSVPARGIDVLARADVVYLEQFTSPVPERDVSRIRDVTGGKLVLAKRWQVEDGAEILKSAKDGEAVLLSYGDPYIATTHIELRTRAAAQGTATGAIHASSALTAIVGECGLHFYKVGRVATIMGGESFATPYRTLYKNMAEGGHTILLLEYDQERDFFLDPSDALAGLLEAEKGQARRVIGESTYCIIASRIGSEDQRITAGMISSLAGTDFGSPPHTVIIPGSLHFTESDALGSTCRCVDAPAGNTVEKISAQMIAKYVPMVRAALEEAKSMYAGKYDDVLENAEMYIRDAEKFLADGHDEVAVLSIGYADGLVDALRMAGGLEPKM
ncbi:MAG: diphthine synthase [Nitrosopumilus sp. H8]|nr:MAG: diphthine synthase [Nitrosopumilus sp. H13]RNJ78884.1 MAG: diphthine synthase [Nitrosopumilus sp. H8]